MIVRVQRTPRPLLGLLSALAVAALWMAPAGALAVSSQAGSKGGESGSEGASTTGGASSGAASSSGKAGRSSSAKGGETAGGSAAAGGGASGGLEGAGTSGLTSGGRERTTTESTGPLGSSAIIFGLGGAAALIAAIAMFIIRDARKNAPVPEGFLENGANAVSPGQARKRRAKAKAARQQRKRNRR